MHRYEQTCFAVLGACSSRIMASVSIDTSKSVELKSHDLFHPSDPNLARSFSAGAGTCVILLAKMSGAKLMLVRPTWTMA